MANSEELQIVTFDVETTIDEKYGPAPQLQSNRPVYTGTLREWENSSSHYSVSRSGGHILVNKPSVIQGHNLTFDLLYACKNTPTLLQDIAKSGCMLWDTQLVEYLLSAQQTKSVSLDKLAAHYDLPLKDDNIKEYFKLGIGADKIDESEILPYLEQDVRVTREIAEGQRSYLAEGGPRLLKLIETQGDALLAITEMAKNGLQVDLKLLSTLRNLRELEQATLRNELTIHIQAMHPNLLSGDINLGSTQLISAYLYGGTIKIDRTEEVKDEDGKPVIYKSGAKKGQIKTRKVKKDYHFSNHYRVPRPAKRNKTGYYQVNDKVLKTIRNTTKFVSLKEFIDRLTKYRDISKELSTYLIGLQDLIFPDGRLYGSINQTITTTGRLSSSKPNLQNMTSKDDSDVKKLFISRYGDDGRIVEADYKQLEVIALAICSGCKRLADDIIHGADIHNETGKSVFPIPMTHDQRRQVKGVNFGLIYGAGPKTLADQVGISVDLATSLASAFYNRYPSVGAWQDDYRAKMNSLPRTSIGATTASGKPQHIVQDVRPTGRLLEYKTYDQPWGNNTGFSPTEMKNYPVQSFATGDIVPMMVGVLFKEIVLAGLYDKCHLVNTVHDSVILDIHVDVLKQSTDLVKEVLEKVPYYLDKNWGIKTDLPFKVEITAGLNWKEQEEIS